MNTYANNVQFVFNYSNNNSDSSDSSASQSSPQMHNNYYDQYANNENKDCQHTQTAYESFDQEMSDDSFHVSETVLGNKNLNTECVHKPPVNRGGRKQVKIGTTKRNARERNRVRFINTCFEVLRDHIPFEEVDEQKNRKLSKVETLKYATLYIKQLSELLETGSVEHKQDVTPVATSNTSHATPSCVSSSISYNNININIYENRYGNTDMYSPTSTSSSSSSSSSTSSSFNNQYHSYSSIPSVGLINSTSCYLNYSNKKALPASCFNYLNESQPANYVDWHTHMNKW